jgi:hypothetical protein
MVIAHDKELHTGDKNDKGSRLNQLIEEEYNWGLGSCVPIGYIVTFKQ